MKPIKIVLLILIMGLSAFFFSKKKPDYSAYNAEVFTHENDSLPYRILYPIDFDKSKKYPVIFFLHGSGEMGNDNKAQLTLGGDLFIKESIRKEFPSIVIFPQCSKNSFWSNVSRKQVNGKEVFDYRTDGKPKKDMELLIKLIEQVETNSYVDKSKEYLMGISMGGMGVFELLRRKMTFAAAVSICGGDTPENADKFGKDVSLWIFHGEEDQVVPAEASRSMAKQLQALGNDVKLTIYPGVGHSSWENALEEKTLLPWLFSKSKDQDGRIDEKMI